MAGQPPTKPWYTVGLSRVGRARVVRPQCQRAVYRVGSCAFSVLASFRNGFLTKSEVFDGFRRSPNSPTNLFTFVSGLNFRHTKRAVRLSSTTTCMMFVNRLTVLFKTNDRDGKLVEESNIHFQQSRRCTVFVNERVAFR